MSELFSGGFKIGKSHTAAAWTDGLTYIAIERSHLREGLKGMAGFQQLAVTLVHEYLHETTDAGSHLHDHEFYEHFHNIVGDERNPVFGAARRMYTQFLAEIDRRGIKIPGNMLRDADRDHGFKCRIEADTAEVAQPSTPEITDPPIPAHRG